MRHAILVPALLLLTACGAGGSGGGGGSASPVQPGGETPPSTPVASVPTTPTVDAQAGAYTATLIYQQTNRGIGYIQLVAPPAGCAGINIVSSFTVSSDGTFQPATNVSIVPIDPHTGYSSLSNGYVEIPAADQLVVYAQSCKVVYTWTH